MCSVSSAPSKVKRSARRCLFGRHDPVQTQLWLNEQLEEIRKREESKFGFNFIIESPIPGTSEYEFFPVSVDSVPGFYRTKLISSVSNSPNQENRNPNSSFDDSDNSLMDCSVSPIPYDRREHATPKKRQGKVTDFMVVRKKRLQHSPKRLEIVLPENRFSTRV
uniref:CDI domain-containing protein n=1 Tax=Heterorhabditis bacteriophora TaxID=37862 RepID=A0A1I7XCW9_HETBA